jgi:hypothetical protein
VGLPYRTLLLVACLVLTARYAVDSEASVTGRCAIGMLTAVSLVLPDGLAWTICSVVLQLGVSLFVLLRMAANTP